MKILCRQQKNWNSYRFMNLLCYIWPEQSIICLLIRFFLTQMLNKQKMKSVFQKRKTKILTKTRRTFRQFTLTLWHPFVIRNVMHVKIYEYVSCVFHLFAWCTDFRSVPVLLRMINGDTSQYSLLRNLNNRSIRKRKLKQCDNFCVRFSLLFFFFSTL